MVSCRTSNKTVSCLSEGLSHQGWLTYHPRENEGILEVLKKVKGFGCPELFSYLCIVTNSTLERLRSWNVSNYNLI